MDSVNGKPTDIIFSRDGFSIRAITDDDLASTLDVYREVEDFLALGPVATASPEMVAVDVKHSKGSGGIFCGIWNDAGKQAGVLDFIPEYAPKTAFLSLLMIARSHRHAGLGTAVLRGLESHLKNVYSTELIESGVQVNNLDGIRFWKSRGFKIDDHAERLEDGTTACRMSKSI
jgi:ribosomal protein S18 acetylase RimI-like enzyme